MPIRNAAAALAAGCLVAATAAAEPQATWLDATDSPIGEPRKLAVDPDRSRLYAADPANDRVIMVDPFTMKQVGSFDFGLDAPHDIGFEADGRVFVADTGNDRVAIFDMADLVAVPYGALSGGFEGPEGVLNHPNGRVYVASPDPAKVVAFEDDEMVGELSGLRAPRDLAATATGDLLVADRDRILLVSPDLEVLGEWSGDAWGFERLAALATLPEGAVIAVDSGADRLVLMSEDGNVLLTVGETGDGRGQFRGPAGVTVVDDTIYVSDPGNERIVKYRVRLD